MYPMTLLLMAIGMSTRAAEPPDGQATIRAKAGASEIVITTTARLAGAIHSLTWNNKEFIDSADHGRQLQSACSFHRGSLKHFWAETYNPTEAGSRKDGAGDRSSSTLLSLNAVANELKTTTRMAFWLAPGEKSSDRPARNDKILSDHEVSKRVKIGYRDWPNVIEYEVTFLVPENEKQTFAQFEAVTGYMPAEFSRFWKFDPQLGELKTLEDGPGEQEFPVVLATPNGSHAMGIFSPDQPSKGFEKAGYGRFRFGPEKVVKWNCVFRIQNEQGVPAGKHTFRSFVIVGSLKEVSESLAGLRKAMK